MKTNHQHGTHARANKHRRTTAMSGKRAQGSDSNSASSGTTACQSVTRCSTMLLHSPNLKKVENSMRISCWPHAGSPVKPLQVCALVYCRMMTDLSVKCRQSCCFAFILPREDHLAPRAPAVVCLVLCGLRELTVVGLAVRKLRAGSKLWCPNSRSPRSIGLDCSHERQHPGDGSLDL